MSFVPFDDLASHISKLKERFTTIVLTTGVFDLLHLGHGKYINDAMAQGDLLVVGVNSDNLVRKMKGPDRPIITDTLRAGALVSFFPPIVVTIFDDFYELMRVVRPQKLVTHISTGKDRNQFKRDIASANGVEVIEFSDVYPEISTSQMIRMVLSKMTK